jgi:membrane-bound lytic murein transglycosylase B
MATRPAPIDVTAMRIPLSHKMESEMQEMRQKLDEMKKQLQLDSELWDITFAHLNDMTTAMLQAPRPQPDMNRAAQIMRARQMMQQRMSNAPPPPPAHQPAPGDRPQTATPAPPAPARQTATPSPQ